MSVSEIHALIQLLDDPDENVYRHVREKFLSRGTEILPARSIELQMLFVLFTRVGLMN